MKPHLFAIVSSLTASSLVAHASNPINLDALLLPEFGSLDEFRLCSEHSASDLQDSVLHSIANDPRFALDTQARANSWGLLLRTVDFSETKRIDDADVLHELLVGMQHGPEHRRTQIAQKLGFVSDEHKPAAREALRVCILQEEDPLTLRVLLAEAAGLRAEINAAYYAQLQGRLFDIQTQNPGVWESIQGMRIRKDPSREWMIYSQLAGFLIEGTPGPADMITRVSQLAQAQPEPACIAMLNALVFPRSRVAELAPLEYTAFFDQTSVVLFQNVDSVRVQQYVLEMVPGLYMLGWMTDDLAQLLIDYADQVDTEGDYLAQVYAAAEPYQPTIAQDVVPSGN